ncbi:MBL fold metallo-hydrolase [Aquimarina sp. U1-2]|uniref:MBL fold metallo-hydrolase n=1 Tax=Aquimarina sp. U1-2 TaxID=2823141 RepID=UPI001AECB3AE|nr:MBL fold metallo-hydrolase [Aquimarina sp. U1-2]MBP2833473.1 MBL fold metallo-hydrolase [Aquimarina sp. U1-2]
MNSNVIFLIVFLLIISCKYEKESNKQRRDPLTSSQQYITILGTAQDGGFPHINNSNEFEDVKKGEATKALVVSLGVVDHEAKKKFLFEATPDMPEQLAILDSEHLQNTTIIDGIFLTHAHIGHYTGLMHLGREAMGAKNINVYAMPSMKVFLETNAPWSQLVDLKNIDLTPLENDTAIRVTDNIQVVPFLVPHRDEFSETVGYKIIGKHKSALFIPDINKWSLWKKNIVEEVKKVDYALIDATFFKNGEIPRPMSEVPHPFIEETVALFKKESEQIKSKIIFIHFNHSNPVLHSNSKERALLQQQGYRFADFGDTLPL